MSGPKVVRIVTREEIIEQCESHLARVEAVVAEWIEVGRRNDLLSEDEILVTKGRLEKLKRLLREEHFAELQKAVLTEIDFLQADQNERLLSAAATKAAAKTMQRQTEAVAASLLMTLKQTNQPLSPPLKHALEEAASGKADGTTAISQAFALLSQRSSPATSDHQRQLADALKEGDDCQTFHQWLANQSLGQDDEILKKLDSQIAELAVLQGETSVRSFSDRLQQIDTQVQSAQRGVLIDSLGIDLAQAITKARERNAIQGRLKMFAAELARSNSETAKPLLHKISNLMNNPTEILLALEKEAGSILDRLRDDFAAQARRQAILKGLADLGYEVSEGLETAWVRNGKVVLKKVSQPGYGVEIAGKADSARMQLRTVVISNTTAPLDTNRSRAAEVIWCKELSELQSQLANAGGEIIIERATPVGVTPLKVIPDTSHTNADEFQEEILSARNYSRG